jgi:hypothetical protein
VTFEKPNDISFSNVIPAQAGTRFIVMVPLAFASAGSSGNIRALNKRLKTQGIRLRG